MQIKLGCTTEVAASRTGKRGPSVRSITIWGMMQAALVYHDLGIEGVRASITSICDGNHMEGSKHYEGLAFDLRTWENARGTQMSFNSKKYLKEKLEEALGEDWDEVIEKDHLHVEYDPRR